MRRPTVLAVLLCVACSLGCEEDTKHGTLLVNNTSNAPLYVAIDPGQITNPFDGPNNEPRYVITLAPNQVNATAELRRGTHNVRFNTTNTLKNGQGTDITVFIRPDSVTPLNIP